MVMVSKSTRLLTCLCFFQICTSGHTNLEIDKGLVSNIIISSIIPNQDGVCFGVISLLESILQYMSGNRSSVLWNQDDIFWAYLFIIVSFRDSFIGLFVF